MTTILSQCATCLHLRRTPGEPWYCAAFPQGIPDEVVESRVDHRQEVEGDGGVRWTPKYADAPHPLDPLGEPEEEPLPGPPNDERFGWGPGDLLEVLPPES